MDVKNCLLSTEIQLAARKTIIRSVIKEVNEKNVSEKNKIVIGDK